VWAGAATGTVALAAAAWLAPPLGFVDLPEGGRVLSYEDGAMGAVSVVQDGDGVARLRINNRQQEGSSATAFVDGRQALLPLLLHPAPQRALFLGLGTGVTASAATLVPGLKVDAVELLPEVIAASTHFTPDWVTPERRARLTVLSADARRYVRASGALYDVVVSDNFHPARSGSGALYTVEHFQAVRQRLASGGVFCQWLPLHQMDLPTLRSVVRSFLLVYPEATAILANNSLETPVLGLLHRERVSSADTARLGPRLAALNLSSAVFGLDDEWAVLGSFVAGPQALARWSAQAAANTDDHPVVIYAAPRLTYAPDSLPRDRLLALLSELSVSPAEVLGVGADPVQAQRLAAYWQARNRFLEVGRAVQPSADVRVMLAQVQAPLLDVLRTSPDCRPAYDPLLGMAVALARQDPAAARELLTALQAAQAERPEAAQALAALPAAARESP